MLQKNTLNIGIAGLGTVGAGVVKLLAEKRELLAARCGKNLVVTAVSSRDRRKDRGISLDGIIWHEDARALAADPSINLVVELIGGVDGVAHELVRSALEMNKHVVTANKALIATHGLELAKLAEKKNVELAFEASVAGGIPILKCLREGLAANRFRRISGILNGTCNYILSEMSGSGRSFPEVLAEAQAKGYAETPPDLDIDGHDAAHKLAILAALAYGAPPRIAAVHTEGIRAITIDDFRYARELGYTIKLLGITQTTEAQSEAAGEPASVSGSEHKDYKIEQRVHPVLVSLASPLAAIHGAQNAVLVECDSLGSVFFSGAGAGAGATASAVVADILDIAAGRASHPFGVPVKQLAKPHYLTIQQHSGAYYVRLRVGDKPGVLAEVTKQLSRQEIGVESVLQRSDSATGTAQIALITHRTKETAITKALEYISKLDYVLEQPHKIRVENI